MHSTHIFYVKTRHKSLSAIKLCITVEHSRFKHGSIMFLRGERQVCRIALVKERVRCVGKEALTPPDRHRSHFFCSIDYNRCCHKRPKEISHTIYTLFGRVKSITMSTEEEKKNHPKKKKKKKKKKKIF